MPGTKYRDTIICNANISHNLCVHPANKLNRKRGGVHRILTMKTIINQAFCTTFAVIQIAMLRSSSISLRRDWIKTGKTLWGGRPCMKRL